jgi:hypothetical protein
MRRCCRELRLALCFLTWMFASAAPAQTTSKPSGSLSPVPADNRAPAFAPGLDDLMTMLIQPRHLKLFYAGIRKNWELAAAEARGLRSAFTRISQTIVKYQGNEVDDAVSTIIVPPLQAVDAAIAAGDAKQFASAFVDLTHACNACHTYMEHPYLKVRVPGSAAMSLYPNQDFAPSP